MKVNASSNRNGVKVNTDRKVNKKKVEQHQNRTNKFSRRTKYCQIKVCSFSYVVYKYCTYDAV